MGKAARASVIVLSWNTKAMTLDCLEALKASIGDLEVEVVVVDNASSDGSAEAIAGAYPDVRLIRNSENLGFARGMNRGLSTVRTTYVVLLNSDAFLLPGAIQHLIWYLDNHPDVAAAGGRQVTIEGDFLPSGHRFPSLWQDILALPGVFDLSHWLLRRGSPLARFFFVTSPGEVDWLSAAFVAVRRSAIEQVGALPEELHCYGEDLEWFWRMRREGWKVSYAGGPGTVHLGSKSAEQLYGDDVPLRVLDGLYVFAVRHRHGLGWRVGWLLKSGGLALLCLRHLLSGPCGRTNSSSSARLLTRFAGVHLRQVLGRYPWPLSSSARRFVASDAEPVRGLE